MTEVYLGRPPAYIEAWMKESSAKSGFDTPFGMTMPEGGTVTLTFNGDSLSSGSPTLYVSKDLKAWTEWQKSTVRSMNLSKGETVYFKAGESDNDGFNGWSLFDLPQHTIFSGNILSLFTQNIGKNMTYGIKNYTNMLGIFSETVNRYDGDIYIPRVSSSIYGVYRGLFSHMATSGNLTLYSSFNADDVSSLYYSLDDFLGI